MAQEQTLSIDQATLRSFHPKAARLNLDGDEIEGPRMVLTFEVEVDRVAAAMNRLTRVFRKRNLITLSLDFPEQLQLEDARRSAESNGHDAGFDGKGTTLTAVEPIGARSKKKKGAETPA